MSDRILIIDDKKSLVEILQTALSEAGYDTDTAMDGETAVKKIKSNEFDLVLADVHLPDMDGTEILKKAKKLGSPPAVVMITAYGSIENAIECMKLGADDYVTKPFNLDEIKEIAKKVLEKVSLYRENIRLREQLEEKYDFAGIIGKSKSMQHVFDMIKRISPSDVSVLITGDTGVGKDLVAKAIHYNSARRDGKFVAINCAAIPENLLESELFGHVRGAFTGAVSAKRGLFEEAAGGTLLLDEIADMQMGLQAKLLRTLDEGAIRRVGDTQTMPTDVRLICSTNKDIEKEVENNNFRLDLFHRIRVIEICIPPLSERREDIMPLAEHYLEKLAAHHSRDIHGFSPDAVSTLLSHSWPGNVRELINVIEQAVLLCDQSSISSENLVSIIGGKETDLRPDDLMQEDSLKKMLARVERGIIKRVLEETGGSRKQAAKRLALSERSLYYKIDEYGLRE